jgi:hypothetical protein
MCLKNNANYSDPGVLCPKLGGGYGLVVQYNYTALHAAPLFQSLADEALVRFALNESSFTVECTIAPLPLTKVEVSYGKAEDAFMAWFLGKFMEGLSVWIELFADSHEYTIGQLLLVSLLSQAHSLYLSSWNARRKASTCKQLRA